MEIYDKDKVRDYLNKNRYGYEWIEHKKVYTIEELSMLDLDNEEYIVKNIFLCDDKKTDYYLVILLKDKRLNLRELRTLLNSRPLRFASQEDLYKYMKLEIGSVSPFGLLNDEMASIKVIIDNDIQLNKHIGVHPNDNSATIFIQLEDLIRIIRKNGNSVFTLSV